MDLIELAERQYARIAPKPGADWLDIPIRDILVWLKDYVCPVVEDYISDAKFQAIARWPLDVLSEARLSDTARLVCDVDRCLVAAARALLAVAESKAIQERIRQQNPPTERIVQHDVRFSTEGRRRSNVPNEVVDHLPAMQAQAQRIAEHRFADLVCRDDYFGPVGSIIPPEELAEIGKQVGHSITEGGLIVSLTPELHLVGDFVTRSMFRRIEIWMTGLSEYRRLVHQAVQAYTASADSKPQAEVPAWAALVVAEAALRKACLTGEPAKLRDACVILTQTYATFHASPELAWLGLSGQLIRRGTALFRHAVESRRSLEALDQIAASLRTLRNLQKSAGGRRDAVIQTGGLVLVQKPPAVYWEKKEVAACWDANPKPFLLLWTLAERAKRGQGFVQDQDFWDEPGAPSRLAQLKSRLLMLVRGTSFSGKIVSVRKQGIRLELEGGQIHLFATPDG